MGYICSFALSVLSLLIACSGTDLGLYSEVNPELSNTNYSVVIQQENNSMFL